MPKDRYFLDPKGVKTKRMQGLPGEGHYEIAQEVLAQKDITPTDYADHYTQMFRLKYARVVEHVDGLVEVEHLHTLTAQ